MTNGIETLRRHIALFEQKRKRVSVRISDYVDVHDTLPDADPIPTKFYFDYDAELDPTAITAAVKADVRAVTGYEPLRFRWRLIDQ